MATWAKKEIYEDRSRIFFDQDYFTAVQKERAKYKPMHKMLREQKIKTNYIYPVQLKVFSQEGIVVYNNLNGLRARGIEVTSEYLDLDVLLRRGGWKITGRHKEGEVAHLTTLLQ